GSKDIRLARDLCMRVAKDQLASDPLLNIPFIRAEHTDRHIQGQPPLVLLYVRKQSVFSNPIKRPNRRGLASAFDESLMLPFLAAFNTAGRSAALPPFLRRLAVAVDEL